MSKGGEKSKVVAGVVIGMALGLAVAGAVAWYVLEKNPAEFAAKEQNRPSVQAAPQPAASAPTVATAPATPAAATEPKQHFEFYKVLTDKSGGVSANSADKPVAKPKEPTAAKPAPVPAPAVASKDMYYVQAGSFQNAGDAEKLKAKLAFSGFEASIQTASIPDKGIWHRVRLGPYTSIEAGKTVAALRQNGVIATQVHVQ